MTPDDRNNEPLDAILRRAMRERPGPATPECADAESLAAYSDKSIAAAERERLETHFADCMRCQLMLADIARAEESARGAEAASEVPWYRRWRVAISAIAAVAAVIVFIAMRRPANEEPQREVVAMAKKEAPAIEVAERAPAVAPSLPAAQSASAPVAPTSPTSNEIAMNEAKQEAAPRAEAMSGGAVLHRMMSPRVPGARAMTAQAGAAGGAGTGAAIGGEALVTISSPDQSVTWIVGKSGFVQRRDAGNSGLRVQQSGVSTDLVAGSAPSSTVCWIVGHSGTIIRTTDGGEHWERIAAPISDNLAQVVASSAKDATITTERGQSFATSDGGVTWRPK